MNSGLDLRLGFVVEVVERVVRGGVEDEDEDGEGEGKEGKCRPSTGPKSLSSSARMERVVRKWEEGYEGGEAEGA